MNLDSAKSRWGGSHVFHWGTKKCLKRHLSEVSGLIWGRRRRVIEQNCNLWWNVGPPHIPENKTMSKEWQRCREGAPVNVKTHLSAEKVLVMCFWLKRYVADWFPSQSKDSEGIIVLPAAGWCQGYLLQQRMPEMSDAAAQTNNKLTENHWTPLSTPSLQYRLICKWLPYVWCAERSVIREKFHNDAEVEQYVHNWPLEHLSSFFMSR